MVRATDEQHRTHAAGVQAGEHLFSLGEIDPRWQLKVVPWAPGTASLTPPSAVITTSWLVSRSAASGMTARALSALRIIV